MRSLVAVLTVLLAACSSENGVDPAACGTLSDDVTATDFVWAPGESPPDPTGGSLQDGTYYLAQETLYGTDSACEDQITLIESRSPHARQALRITTETETTGTMEIVTTVTADPVRASARYTIVDSTLTFASVCGSSPPFSQGAPFTAVVGNLVVFPAIASCGPEVAVFERF
jgi:hypothetical protein